jgi:hypothetical protein
MTKKVTERKEGYVMALTKTQLREILSAAGVSAEKAEAAITQIMDGHLASVNALREERDSYKADAEKLPAVQKELDGYKSQGGDSYKEKYEKEHQDFEDYKSKQTAKELLASKTDAYRSMLKEAGVSEKRIDTVIKASTPTIESLSLDKDGKVANSGDVLKSIKTDWADFITKEESKGASTPTPPGGGSGKVLTKEEILKIKDTTERQAAWGEFLKAQQTG